MPLLFILGLAGFASACSLRATDPMLTLMADDLSVSLQQAALLTSCFAVPYALMQLILGPVGDAVGKTRLIRVVLGLLTLGQALSAIAPDYHWLVIGRVLTGSVSGGIIPVAMAVIGDRVALEERQISIGRFLLGVILGQMGGAFLAGHLANSLGWRGVFAILAAIAALAFALSLRSLRGDPPATRPSFATAMNGYRAVFSNPAAISVYGLVCLEGMLIFAAMPFLGVSLTRIAGALPENAGNVLAIWAMGGVIYSLAVRRLVRQLGLWRMMQLGGLLAGLALIACAPALPWPAVAAIFLINGFGYYMIHNTLQTQATELAPSARGSALALFSCALFLGQGLGPLVAGGVAAQFGYGAMFITLGGPLILLGFIGAPRLRHLQARAQTGKS